MTTTDKGAPEGSARVTDEELGRVAAADVTAPDGRWEFHRIQLGYTDGIPRAVFVEPDDEPVGIPLIWNAAVIMKLAQKLAAEVRAQRSTVAERDAQIARLAVDSAAVEAKLTIEAMTANQRAEGAEKLAADRLASLDFLRKKARAVTRMAWGFGAGTWGEAAIGALRDAIGDSRGADR